MGKVDAYRTALRRVATREPWLAARSNLPEPRANLHDLDSEWTARWLA